MKEYKHKMRDIRFTNGLINFCDKFLNGKKDLIGIEIGSFSGESAQIFIKTQSFQKLYCIDPWKNGYDKTDIASQQNQQAQKYFDQRFKNEDRIIKIKDYSSNVSSMFENESIDFVYIDGCHQYQSVKQDIQNYFPKIKNGGIISGHDFNLYDVRKAVIENFKTLPICVFNDNSWGYYK